MAQLNINIGSHGELMTVREMRKQLAKTLSLLDGAQEVTFSFTANLPHYHPNGGYCFNIDPEPTVKMSLSDGPTVVYGELARPDNGR